MCWFVLYNTHMSNNKCPLLFISHLPARYPLVGLIVESLFPSLSALGPSSAAIPFWIDKQIRERESRKRPSLLHQYHHPLPINSCSGWLIVVCFLDGSSSIKKWQKIVSLQMAMGDGKVGLTDVPMALTHPTPASLARIPPADCCVPRFVGYRGWEGGLSQQ